MAKKWRRIVEQDCYDLAEQRGFEYLGGYAGKAHGKVKWRCPEGHEWRNSYSQIKYGKGCPYCAGNMRLQESDYHQMAQKNGVYWNGPLPPNNYTATEWECPDGHTWMSTYCALRISINNGCPHCAGNARKTEQDYHDLARERGFKFIGPYPQNIMTSTRWECSEGHQWENRYDNIRTGSGCPHCAQMVPKTREDYVAAAKAAGVEFLGPVPATTKDRAYYRCENGHVYQTSFGSIRKGSGCRQCWFDKNRGPNHYLWNHEKTDEEREADRKYREYEHWRQAVYERDDWTCATCKQRGGNLVAHHLNSYTEYENLRTEVDNGVTLCEPCHITYHVEYGWSGACVDDFVEFAASHGVHFVNPLSKSKYAGR